MLLHLDLITPETPTLKCAREYRYVGVLLIFLSS